MAWYLAKKFSNKLNLYRFAILRIIIVIILVVFVRFQELKIMYRSQHAIIRLTDLSIEVSLVELRLNARDRETKREKGKVNE